MNVSHGVIVLSLLFLLVPGCGTDLDGVMNHQRNVVLTGPEAANVTFGDFEVTYTGRVFDGSTTTFSYTVTGPAENMHFRVGWPVTECTNGPVSWIPISGSTGNNDCCINPGLEWHEPTGNGPYYFSYSFAGDVPEGTIPASIKNNSAVILGEITGPGIPTYIISGTVFQDANASGLFDAGETSIPGVSISLSQDDSVLASTTSDASGNYAFEVQCGSYSVEIDTSTLTGTQKTYFISTTPVAYSVSVGPDSPDHDFGFEVNSAKAIADLENGTLATTGATAAFWKKEYQFGSAGRNGFFPRDSMIVFLDRLEELSLPTPFVFTGTESERLNAAYQILRKPVRSDFDALERELLALELNHVAGFGIDRSTQLVMIGWGETLYNDTQTTNIKAGAMMASGIGDATEVYQGINSNKSPGGGGGTR